MILEINTDTVRERVAEYRHAVKKSMQIDNVPDFQTMKQGEQVALRLSREIATMAYQVSGELDTARHTRRKMLDHHKQWSSYVSSLETALKDIAGFEAYLPDEIRNHQYIGQILEIAKAALDYSND